MAVVNRTGGQLRISVLGKNLTTKEVDLYQISILTGEGITMSTDPLSSGNYDMITVKARDGHIIGQVQGDEQDPNGEISFSFYEDFDFLGKTHVYGNSKDRLKNILNGEAFHNAKGEVIVPIGTNGTDKTTKAKAKFSEMNKPYRMVMYNEAEFIKENGTANAETGKPTLRKNPFKSSFDMFNKTFCFELMTTTGQGQVNRMLPVLAKKTLELAEGDINQNNCTAQRGCDMWEKDEFFSEVYTLEDVSTAETTMKNYNELPVDFIVVNGGSEPEASSNNDKLLVNIDAGGVPTIKKSNGSTWEEESNLKDLITIGTRFKAKRVENGTGIDCNVFVAVGEDGEKCVDFSTDGKKRYFCKVKDFDYNLSLDFEDYKTE